MIDSMRDCAGPPQLDVGKELQQVEAVSSQMGLPLDDVCRSIIAYGGDVQVPLRAGWPTNASIQNGHYRGWLSSQGRIELSCAGGNGRNDAYRLMLSCRARCQD